MKNKQEWLNGNYWESGRSDHFVEGCIYCIGCGRFFGVVCFIPTINYKPLPKPDYPFNIDDCPVCLNYRESIPTIEAPKSVLEAYKLGFKRGSDGLSK